MFGEPNKGIHKYRFLNVAIVDVIMTIIGGILIHRALNYYKFNIKLYIVIISLFVLGIIAHRIFCVRTTIDKLLFKNV